MKIIDEFHTDLLSDEENALISNPEKWFFKLRRNTNKSFEEYLFDCVFPKRDNATISQRGRKQTLASTRMNMSRLRKLARSLLRKDKKTPPSCIFCLDGETDTIGMCGRLQWCPEMPLFFAVHELCTLMIPEIVTIDNPTPLGKELFQTDLKFLNQAFIRGRLLTCTTCREKGALVGCCFATCRSVFHLPCAIRSMCYINYEEFRCFCPRHSSLAFKIMKDTFFPQPSRKSKQENFGCCICMERVEGEMKMHSVIQTNCCGVEFYHFDCIKNASVACGHEMRCPKCNRSNKETGFVESISRQGIYFQTYVSFTDSVDDNYANYRSRCYYAMTRCSAKERSCLSSLGPDRYDDSDALNDAIYNPLEALNACISCGVHCHRICAGEPWSLYNPDDEGDEEMWQCEDCRDTLQTSAVKFTTPVSSVESTQTKNRTKGNKRRKSKNHTIETLDNYLRNKPVKKKSLLMKKKSVHPC